VEEDGMMWVAITPILQHKKRLYILHPHHSIHNRKQQISTIQEVTTVKWQLTICQIHGNMSQHASHAPNFSPANAGGNPSGQHQQVRTVLLERSLMEGIEEVNFLMDSLSGVI
jgi:hypothetical protein